MSNFRQPLRVDERGLYITEGQMEFFMNIYAEKHGVSQGTSLEMLKSDEFLTYYENCVLYNIIWDMMKEDEDCAQMYWDVENQEVSFQFPEFGKVWQRVVDTEVFGSYEDEGEDEDEDWGLGL